MDHHDEDFLRRAAAAKARVSQVDPGEVDALLAAGAVAIDVREADEHARGTVPGATNISIGSLAERIAAEVPDLDAPIVCFCSGGNRGALAAAALEDLGYTNVKSIAGGLLAYKARKEGE